MSKPPDIKDIIAGFHGQGRKYDFEFDPTTGRPTRIKTDGSAQDNADALAMARVVFAQPLPPPLQPVPVHPVLPPPAVVAAGMTLKEAMRKYEAAEAGP